MKMYALVCTSKHGLTALQWDRMGTYFSQKIKKQAYLLGNRSLAREFDSPRFHQLFLGNRNI